ncbi:MAG: enoyl-CoA hydratase/isomerase family protein [Myxococcota bacterium]
MPGKVLLERDGTTGWIIFDHPARRNALSNNMWAELAAACIELDDDPGVRVVVLRGACRGQTNGRDPRDMQLQRRGSE